MKSPAMEVLEAHAACQRTDDAWGAELRRLFGSRAGDVRYTPQGKGDAGSDLRRLYEAREAARISWDKLRGYDEHGRRT